MRLASRPKGETGSDPLPVVKAQTYSEVPYFPLQL